MKTNALVTVSLFILLLMTFANADSSCPANDPNIGPYNKVTIFNAQRELKGYKLVNEAFIVQAVRVDGGVEEPLKRKSVKIYFQEGKNKQLLESGKTDNRGEFTYTPTKLGRFIVETSGKAVMIDIKKIYDDPTELGAVCGNGICEEGKLEDNGNCPIDCTICGDAFCEGNENKDNCPEDCIICGDGECDPAEYWPGGCSCIEDCIICGDGVCDEAHGENSNICSDDCEKEVGDDIDDWTDYWWLGGIFAAIIILFLAKDRISKGEDEKKGDSGETRALQKKKKKKESFEDDEEIESLMGELMNTGVSEKKMKEQLGEFGLEEREASRLISKAKKKR